MIQRDSFAMRAMAALLSYGQHRRDVFGGCEYSMIAKEAYLYADAMLKERERTNKSQAQKELEK